MPSIHRDYLGLQFHRLPRNVTFSKVLGLVGFDNLSAHLPLWLQNLPTDLPISIKQPTSNLIGATAARGLGFRPLFPRPPPLVVWVRMRIYGSWHQFLCGSVHSCLQFHQFRLFLCCLLVADSSVSVVVGSWLITFMFCQLIRGRLLFAYFFVLMCWICG